MREMTKYFVIIVLIFFTVIIVGLFGQTCPNITPPRERCVVSTQLNCIDRPNVREDGEINFILRNEFEKPVKILSDLGSSGRCKITSEWSINGIKSFPFELKPNELAEVKVKCEELNVPFFYSPICHSPYWFKTEIHFSYLMEGIKENANVSLLGVIVHYN